MRQTSILLLEFAFLPDQRQDTKTILTIIKKDGTGDQVTELVEKQHRALFQNEPIDQETIDGYKDCLREYRVIYLDHIKALMARSKARVV